MEGWEEQRGQCDGEESFPHEDKIEEDSTLLLLSLFPLTPSLSLA